MHTQPNGGSRSPRGDRRDGVPGADTLVLIVHGLGGSALAPYCAAGARAARRAGFASLRLSLRGADLSGEDLYHGGLVEDLRAALASLQAAAYRRVLLLGYSVGGHVALRAALDRIDPRIRAVVAVCSPLDLALSVTAFDEPCRHNYWLTARHWAERLDQGRDEVVRRWGERLYRRFRLDLWGCVHRFGTGGLEAYRLLLRLPPSA